MTNYVQQVIDQLYEEMGGDIEVVKLYALLALTLGEATMEEDVHDAWAVWRNTTQPEHRNLVPFDQLDAETQARDTEYVEAIHRVCRALNLVDPDDRHV